MATLPDLRPVRLEAYEDVPDYVEAVVNTLNRFMKDVFFALSALTFQDNLAARIQDITFTSGASYTAGDFTPIILPNIGGPKISAVLLLRIFQVSDPAARFLAAPAIANWSTDQSSVRINYVSGLLNNTKYTLTLLIF